MPPPRRVNAPPVPMQRTAARRRTTLLVAAFLSSCGVPVPARSQANPEQPRPVHDLVGLWEAKRHFGPDVRGRLVILATGLPDQPHPKTWRATIAARTATVHLDGDMMSFTLPDRSGAFIGTLDTSTATIRGHWIQPPTWLKGGEVASPLSFVSCGANCFAAEVVPLNDEYTFYLHVTRRSDGSLGAVLRNPERNLGRRIGPDRLELAGDTVRWLDTGGREINRGILRDSVMTVFIGGRGGSYDFRRLPDSAFTYFYARGYPTAAYGYRPPLQTRDGWAVASLEDVGMSRDTISALMRELTQAATDSLGALKVHGLLVARHGKLVLEEYFYGEHGDKPHDTRSASKTLTSIVLGAAAHAGARLGPETPVYATLRPGREEPNARRRALRLEHLLTMSSGLECDDNDESSPGNEEVVFATSRDWTESILGLNMVRDPGAEIVYCGAGVQLAGSVISRVTGRPMIDLMRDLVASPLGIQHYYAGLNAAREGVLPGGWYFLPRDFMKLGQLYLNGGTWQGRQVVSADWVKRSTAVRYQYGRRLRYGYLWWIIEYPFRGRSVQAYFASGLGGQEVMVFPELDLVVAVFGGNYNDDEANWAMVVDLIPRYVLGAIVSR
jgi:CubicO group peptidase (beta-lactamase class C family)